ncbi:hypothetical protein AQUCO_00700013v1 [Aquilegia coerulea]|uniref:TATA-binding protein interacting (TIP20) domain-containing protein n=1 Tax=Aquilegia coerulea TaxID=218851 RepID=A0A2G5EI42_AQUCA|nr:hypothetical protein AQUCO_00700013v1 [Aquilegia coerulea]
MNWTAKELICSLVEKLYLYLGWLLNQEVPKIVKSINRQLREKSIKTKIGEFSVLKELVVEKALNLGSGFYTIFSSASCINHISQDKSSTSNLKIEALIFTRLVMASHSPSVFHLYIEVLSSPILNAVSERYYKVTHAFSVIASSPLKIDLSCVLDHVIAELTTFLRKAFSVIASSPLKIDLSRVLDHVIAEFTTFLRKANRALRQATLGTLNSLVAAYGDRIGSSAYETITVELSNLISDSDLHMTALALVLCYTLMSDKKCSPVVCLTVRYKALQNFFADLVHSANTSFDDLLDSLLSSVKPSPQSGGLAKQALYSVAQFVAVLCLAAGDQKCASTVEMITSILKDDSTTNSVIARQSVSKAGQAEFQATRVEKILKLLFNYCETEEEGVRNAVSECLGKIALIDLAKLVPALKVWTTSPAAFTRATVAIAIKYSMVERPEKIDEIIFPEICSFLMLIKDHDPHVRRAAVLALSTAAHNKPNLIKGHLPELLPLLYDQTVFKQELIRMVDLGSFKHIVDDGHELRKASFECVDTLLDTCLDQVNPSSFIVPFLRSGLDDHYDVKMLSHLILSKLADKCFAAVLAVLDSLVDPLQKTVNRKPKQDAVKQEVDLNEDMIRSALRAIASLNRISGGDCSLKFKSLMNEIMRSSVLAEKFNSISNE